jgi:hypothetical protein
VNTLKYDVISDSVMPQFLIELKKSGNEVLHIILFVIRDDCGNCVEISVDSENLLVNRLVELQPAGKVYILPSCY